MTIVTTHYRPKRARKKKPAVALTGPRITTLIRRAPAAEQPAPSGLGMRSDSERFPAPATVSEAANPIAAETRPVVAAAHRVGVAASG